MDKSETKLPSESRQHGHVMHDRFQMKTRNDVKSFLGPVKVPQMETIHDLLFFFLSNCKLDPELAVTSCYCFKLQCNSLTQLDEEELDAGA